MTVLAMDGDALGRVCEVGDHALALERGTHKWKVSFIEVARVDERGVWLRHGRKRSLEHVEAVLQRPHRGVPRGGRGLPVRPVEGFRPAGGLPATLPRHAEATRARDPPRRRRTPPARLTTPAGPSRLAATIAECTHVLELKPVQAHHQGLRGLSEDGPALGSTSGCAWPLWPRGLLRLEPQPTRDEALPREPTPNRPVDGAGRGLGMVFRGRGGLRGRRAAATRVRSARQVRLGERPGMLLLALGSLPRLCHDLALARGAAGHPGRAACPAGSAKPQDASSARRRWVSDAARAPRPRRSSRPRQPPTRWSVRRTAGRPTSSSPR